MHYVYVLKSGRDDKRYIGFTDKDPNDRLEEHMSGTNSWTRQNRPFKLVYQEEFDQEIEARKRERFLKNGQGRKFLDELLK